MEKGHRRPPSVRSDPLPVEHIRFAPTQRWVRTLGQHKFGPRQGFATYLVANPKFGPQRDTNTALVVLGWPVIAGCP